MDIGGPPSHPNRDEVIADSEEELEYARSFSALTTLHTNAVSSISDFTTIPHPCSDEIVSDRTRTRQRTQGTKKLPVVQDDIIELTSEDDAVEKSTKSSARSIKPKLKAKMVDNPLLEASKSHNDSSGSRPRVRPRPKPIVKRVQPKLDSLPLHQYPFASDSLVYDPPAIPLPPMLTTAFYRRQPDLPIATSPASINHTMGHGVVSQLPPSDPPNSTNTTGIGGKSSRPEDSPLPPIEILQDGESERDGDSRLLSPSSLFSDKGSRSKAKKRNRGVALNIQDKEHEVDQLIPSSPHCREPTPHVAVDAYTHGPPPTFFAGSSSSVRDNGERDPTPFPNPQAEVIDLTDLPPTMKPSKPNKIKKQMVNNEVIPTEGLRGDEGDSDFKPSGKKAVKKRKGKGKEPVVDQKENKPKEKKEKKKQQLDGVVLAKRTKTKGKPIEKEVFKSREVIDDSDDDTDPLLLVGGMQVDNRMPLPSTTDGTSSLRVSDLNQGGLSSASDKSPRSKIDEPNSSTSASAVSKEKTKSKGKKRKSIVESNEEGSEKGNDIQDKDCIVVKRRKSASGAPVYDGVEQEQVDKKRKSQESVRSGKDEPEVPKTPGSAGANQDETMQMKDSDVCQRTRIQKENMSSGPSAPSVARPLAGRTASINPDSSTPLYARYEVAPRRSSLPMSELIRRASIKPGSPFSASFTPSHKDRSKGKKPGSDVDAASDIPQSLTTYSPYLKMSRRALSKIAPLHLNRRTPPPPAPAPPLKKKTKKEIEREEKWEEELVETVGIDVWASMEDSERKEMRRAKIDMEMGGYDD